MINEEHEVRQEADKIQAWLQQASRLAQDALRPLRQALQGKEQHRAAHGQVPGNGLIAASQA